MTIQEEMKSMMESAIANAINASFEAYAVAAEKNAVAEDAALDYARAKNNEDMATDSKARAETWRRAASMARAAKVPT